MQAEVNLQTRVLYLFFERYTPSSLSPAGLYMHVQSGLHHPHAKCEWV